MGKKHKKKKYEDEYSVFGIKLGEPTGTFDDYKIDRRFTNDVANTLERFVEIAKNYLINLNVSYEEKEKAIDVIEKAIKDLRKGKVDSVWTPDAYEEQYRIWLQEKRKI